MKAYSSASVVEVFFLRQRFPEPQQHRKYLKMYSNNINQTMGLHKDLNRNHFIQRYLYSCVYTRSCIQWPRYRDLHWWMYTTTITQGPWYSYPYTRNFVQVLLYKDIYFTCVKDFQVKVLYTGTLKRLPYTRAFIWGPWYKKGLREIDHIDILYHRVSIDPCISTFIHKIACHRQS